MRDSFARFVTAEPSEIDVIGMLDALPVWALAAVLVVVWVLAERTWARSHTKLDGPHIRIKKAKGAKAHARKIRKAYRTKDDPRQHYWSLPGVDIVSEHLLISGGTRTGKTKRLLLYLLVFRLRQSLRSLFVIDPKGEIFDLVIPLLGKWSGQPLVYLVSCLERHRDEHINPINPMVDAAAAMSFFRSSVRGEDESQEDSYFDNAGSRMGYQLRTCQIRKYGGTDATRVYDAMNDPRELDRLAEEYPGILTEWRGSQETRGPHESNRSTFVTAWSGMELHHIRRIFDTRGSWQAGPKWDERTACFLAVSPTEAEQAPGLIRAVVQYAVTGASNAYERGGPKVTAIFEEAGTFSPSKQMEIWINLYRGKGLNAAVITQSRAQFLHNLGEFRTEAMLTSISGTIYGPTSSVRDSEMIEAAAGKTRIRPPRHYVPLIGWALYALLAVPGLILSAFLDYEQKPRSNDKGSQTDLILVSRYPAEVVRRMQDDPAKIVNQPVRKFVRKLRLWITGEHIMRDGMYLVVQEGATPFVLDSTSAYFPGYADKLRRSDGKPRIRFGPRAQPPGELPGGPEKELLTRDQPGDPGPRLKPAEPPGYDGPWFERAPAASDPRRGEPDSGEDRDEESFKKRCAICGAPNPPTATLCTCGTDI